MLSLIVQEKGAPDKSIPFDKTELTIGRVQGNDLILAKGNISKKHARLVVKDGKVIIVDLKSTNDPYVDGRKVVSPLVIKSEDKIYIDDYVLRVEGSSEADYDEEDAPPPSSEGSEEHPSRRITVQSSSDIANGLMQQAQQQQDPPVLPRTLSSATVSSSHLPPPSQQRMGDSNAVF